jgi:hypothetical protein
MSDNKIKGGATIWARQTIESDIFFWKPDKWFKIWFYIVSKANHKIIGKFNRGQCFLTYKDIQEATHSTKSEVDHCFRWLKSATMLATHKSTRGMIITIIKYGLFQDLNNYYYDKSDNKSEIKATEKRQDKQECKNDKNKENDFFQKSLLKVKNKKMRTYNENESYEEPVVNEETGQLEEKKKKEPKNKLAMTILDLFILMANKETGIKPIKDKKGYFIILDALKYLDKKQIIKLFDDWFGSGRPNNELISITRALSHNNINKFKLENDIKN